MYERVYYMASDLYTEICLYVVYRCLKWFHFLTNKAAFAACLKLMLWLFATCLLCSKHCYNLGFFSFINHYCIILIIIQLSLCFQRYYICHLFCPIKSVEN